MGRGCVVCLSTPLPAGKLVHSRVLLMLVTPTCKRTPALFPFVLPTPDAAWAQDSPGPPPQLTWALIL